MAGLVTDLVEIAVGVACIGIAAGARRRPGWGKAIAVAFALAGLAAIGHGVASALWR